MSGVRTEREELWLELVSAGRRVLVPGDRRSFVIGRSAAASLVITDPACSREQARIQWDGNEAILEPLALRQPTLVNALPHDRPVALAHGDVIRCGTTELRVLFIASGRGTPSGAHPAIRSGGDGRDGGGLSATEVGDPAGLLESPGGGRVEIDGELLIGRVPGTRSLVLDHPAVSRRHAVVLRDGGALVLRDLGSTNGTFVNGERIAGRRTLRRDDQVRAGPFAFTVADGALVPVTRDVVAELRTQALTYTVNANGNPRRLLQDVSVAFRAREFVAVIGPSGCGKSTLIRILSGRATPTEGVVWWNGDDLHRFFAAVKQEIAFVPQRETLPELLTVRQVLTYTARLRLPGDATAADVDALVADAIARVGLHDQADLIVARLSGGQRKRASLANELLVRPSLMFLDEVTSGLDEATDREMMEVFRALADSGIVVVCVTHTLANVERWCDSLLVMARGGVVAYHGPVAQARAHFGVTALGDIYQELENVDAAQWGERHNRRSPYRSRVASPPAARKDESAAVAVPVPRDRRPPFTQWRVLLERYLEVTLADRRTLAMAAVQSVVIGGFLRLVFGGATPTPPHEYLLVFLLGVSAFWFGCNNAAKEIIKERALFALERDVNLRLPSYFFSKLVVLGVIGSLQVATLFAIVRLAGLTFAEPAGMLVVMLLTLMAGTSCGLLISAAAASEDQAITIVPIALIPQILLSEAVVAPLPDLARYLAKGGITAYWMYRSQLEWLNAPGVEGRESWIMLVVHVAGYTSLALAALWWRDRRRRGGGT